MKYFYICVAEFEADETLTEIPEPYFPNIKEGSLRCKQSIEPVGKTAFKFNRTYIRKYLNAIAKYVPPESEYTKTYLDQELLDKNPEKEA